MPGSDLRKRNYLHIFFALFAATVTAAVFFPSLSYDFVNWDDSVYVYENPTIRNIDKAFINKIFTSSTSHHWHPLTILSLAIDYQIWGNQPKGYHLTNLILHVFNVILVYLISVELIRERNFSDNQLIAIGFLTALLFGTHPLHVESVVWISERKDILYAFFYLLSAREYLVYIRTRGKQPAGRHYLFSLIFFMFSLMSKPMAVSFPGVLLIIDFYFSRRPLSRPILREKIPYFLLAIAVSLTTLYVQHGNNSSRYVDARQMFAHLAVGIESYVFYLQKMFIPFSLSPFYPYPAIDTLPDIYFVVALFILCTITFFCVRMLRTEKSWLTAWLFYIITLLPVTGLIKIRGSAFSADRYTYLTVIGALFLINVGITLLYDQARHSKRRVIIACTFVVVSCLVLKTIRQIPLWKDPITLWTHQIKLYPSNVLAYVNRGAAYNALGNIPMAVADYDQAILLNPENFEAYANRASINFSHGRYRNALEDINNALRISPGNTELYYYQKILYKVLESQ